MPIVRLAGLVAVVIGLVVALNLRGVLRKDAWSERTILAFAIVFSFCLGALMVLPDPAFAALKDVALVVVGFYFGSMRANVPQPSSGAVATPPPSTPAL